MRRSGFPADRANREPDLVLGSGETLDPGLTGGDILTEQGDGPLREVARGRSLEPLELNDRQRAVLGGDAGSGDADLDLVADLRHLEARGLLGGLEVGGEGIRTLAAGRLKGQRRSEKRGQGPEGSAAHRGRIV